MKIKYIIGITNLLGMKEMMHHEYHSILEVLHNGFNLLPRAQKKIYTIILEQLKTTQWHKCFSTNTLQSFLKSYPKGFFF